MTQKSLGKTYIQSSLFLLLEMGETVTSKEKNPNITVSLLCSSPLKMNFFYILRHYHCFAKLKTTHTYRQLLCSDLEVSETIQNFPTWKQIQIPVLSIHK